MRTSLTRTYPGLPAGISMLNHNPCCPDTLICALRLSVATVGALKSGAACTSTDVFWITAAMFSVRTAGSPPESNRYRSKRVGGLREAIATRIPRHVQSTRRQASYSVLPHGDVVDEAFHRFLIAIAFVRGEGIQRRQRAFFGAAQQLSQYRAHACARLRNRFVGGDRDADHARHAH